MEGQTPNPVVQTQSNLQQVPLKRDFSIIDALNFGWQTTFRNLGSLVRIFWPWPTVFVLVIVTSTVFGVDVDRTTLLGGIINSALDLFSLVATCTLLLVSLKLVDNRMEDLNSIHIFNGFPYFLSYVIATVLVGLKIILGFILLIIPGVIFSIQNFFVFFIIFDKKIDAKQAMKYSKEISKGHGLKIIILFLAITALQILGVVAFFVGLFVTVPIGYLAIAFAYRALSPSQNIQVNPATNSTNQTGFKPLSTQ